MKKVQLTIFIFLSACLISAQTNRLNAVFTDTSPTVDGISESMWDNAPELAVALGETYDTQDPASITDCAGCHQYNSDVSVKLKALYTNDKIFIKAQWPDSTASFTRGGAWSFTNNTWEKLNPTESEDRMSFFWPMGEITGTNGNNTCMSKCHTYYPTDTDPHVSTHGIVDDAWLISGKADMWHSKGGRGAGYLSTEGTNIIVDPTTHEVTAGSLSMIGFADDKWVGQWAPDSINGEDGGRYGDAGTSGYSHNRIGDKSRPKFMEKAPTDYGDAMILTQEEIDNGECVGDATTGVTDVDAATYWPVYNSFNAIVPERILRHPLGSRGDLGFGAVWTDGIWTAEFSRDLANGNDDDVQFDINNQYPFGVAQFDNSRHGYQHRTSTMKTLHFLSNVPATGELLAKKTDTPPTVDGISESMWDNAPELAVALGETYDTQDPASITDCAGCHQYNSDVSVKLKALYTNDKIFIKAQWPDSTASFTRGGAWSFTNNTWEKLNPTESEDRMSFFWPMGEITGTNGNNTCMSKCHTYYPTDTDPHVSTHGIVDDAWLISGKADMWHSKGGRGAGYLSTEGTNIIVDPTTHEVTAGSLSMIGFADDKWVGQWAPDSINGEDGGRYGDAGTSGYSHNRIGDKSRPKFMEKAPTDYGDAMILTQEEIDNGECVGDATTGVTDVDAATYWPVYNSFNAIVPERILRHPLGSRGDLGFGAVWTDGIWTAEFSRDLANGNDDDVQFDINNQYPFGVAQFDNSRHGYQHRTSTMKTLRFDISVGVDNEKNELPSSYTLSQNYPNPFNPTTTISYSIPQNSRVELKVYDMLGNEITTLVNKPQTTGTYRTVFDASDLSSGVYFYKITAGKFVATKKLLLLK